MRDADVNVLRQQLGDNLAIGHRIINPHLLDRPRAVFREIRIKVANEPLRQTIALAVNCATRVTGLAFREGHSDAS